MLEKQVVGIVRGPFPVSYDDSSVMFGFALFSLIVVTALALMLGGLMTNHLWKDRKRGYDGVAAIRTLVLAVCTVSVIRCSPEVIYNISYAEASEGTLRTILFAKRLCDAASLIPVIVWMGTFWAWYPDIALRLRAPFAIVRSDHRLASLNRFVGVVLLSGALASVITVGRALG